VQEILIAKATLRQADLRIMARRSREQIIVAFLTIPPRKPAQLVARRLLN
jgi:hypothetical protein